MNGVTPHPDPDWIAHVDAAEDIPPPELPDEAPFDASSPLAGLTELSRVAVLGHAALVELSQRKIDYVWAPVAAPGWTIMFASAPGIGKTTALTTIVAARANLGTPIRVMGLLMQPAPMGTYFIFIEGEVDEIATARKLRASCKMLGVDEHALDRVVVIARKAVRVGDPVWADIERLIAKGLVSDIALDSVARCAPADAETNDEAAQTKMFDLIAKAVDLAPAGTPKPIAWLIAHTRKGNGTIGVDDVLGSRARTAQVDSLIMLDGRKEHGRVIDVTATFEKLRHDPEEHPMPVTITIDRDPATRALRYVAGSGPTTSSLPLEQQIAALLLAKGPMTKTSIAGGLRRSVGDVQRAIDAMFASGQLKGAQVKTRTGTYSAVDLKDAWEGGRPSSGLGPKSESDSKPDEGGLFR